MSLQLDAVYRSQRLRLYSTVSAGVAQIWASNYKDRSATIERSLSLVAAGQARTVALVDAYMAAKVRVALGKGDPKGLNPARYTVDKLRGSSAENVYERPFGAFGAHLASDGEDGFAAGMDSAAHTLARLARTDLQLAQTHAARDWMFDDSRVPGYERILGGGKNCELCIAASGRRYYSEDLAPIHENCGCSVAPVFDAAGLERASNLSASDVRVSDDPEIGPRLLAPTWAG